MKLSICAIFRNESLYLKEWLEFHIIQGAEVFYLYNNRSDDDYLSVLEPYIQRGIVILTHWPYYPPCQSQAYTHCIDHHLRESEWCAFIDIDEFLFSPRYDTVTEVLDMFPKEWKSIGVNWMCFGSSGKQEWEDIPVIERFTWRPKADIASNHYIKSIVRMDEPFTISDPHFPNIITTRTPSGCHAYGSHAIPHEHNILRINHYGTKSRSEWVKRQLLGKPCAPNAPSPEACYQEVQAMDVDDREIHRYLHELKRRLE